MLSKTCQHKDGGWQEELVQSMRSEGRKQATHRIMRQKRDGQLTHALMTELDTLMATSQAQGMTPSK